MSKHIAFYVIPMFLWSYPEKNQDKSLQKLMSLKLIPELVINQV